METVKHNFGRTPSTVKTKASQGSDMKGNEERIASTPVAWMRDAGGGPSFTTSKPADDAQWTPLYTESLDADRYRWFRALPTLDDKLDILEAAQGEPDLLDHHIDKRMCGL